jgi:hypothetical protein
VGTKEMNSKFLLAIRDLFRWKLTNLIPSYLIVMEFWLM